jgi:YspA, cpYpsA-related SLOG family
LKVIIAGGREVNDIIHIVKAVELSGFDITEVVSGTARGADIQGEIWATRNKVPVKRFPAQWKDKDGNFIKSAGFVRNAEMVKYADALIAVWDGMSKGTSHTILLAQKKGIPTFVHKYKEC